MRRLLDVCLILIYVGAIIVANGAVTIYGQKALVFTAFILIPFDLVVRDLLQDRWQSKQNLWYRMLMLVGGGSIVSYLTTVASVRVASASMIAFSLTGLIDCVTYQAMIRLGRVVRINGATFVAAFTDSLVFVLVAFDHCDPLLVLGQSLSKILGGLVWSLLLYRFFKRRA